MPKKEREKPFVWPSWISKLVAGECQCEWAYWFKSHFMYDKKPSDFNLHRWSINHNQLVHSRRDALEKLGFTVTIEDQNSFKMIVQIPVGEDFRESILHIDVVISGKADLVALGKEEDPRHEGDCLWTYLVEDCKTGNPKTSDHVQVILYMLFLPLAVQRYKDAEFSGCIVYKAGVPNVDIPSEAATKDEELKKIIWDTIKRIAGNEVNCCKVPSMNECRRCDITCADCSERIENG